MAPVVVRWIGVAVAGAAPVLAVIRLRQHLATLDARAAAAAPAHGAWLRWHGPVVFLCMHEALAHLSFLLTGHRGLVRSRIGAVQAEGAPRPAGRSSCGAPSVGCSDAGIIQPSSSFLEHALTTSRHGFPLAGVNGHLPQGGT